MRAAVGRAQQRALRRAFLGGRQRRRSTIRARRSRSSPRRQEPSMQLRHSRYAARTARRTMHNVLDTDVGGRDREIACA